MTWLTTSEAARLLGYADEARVREALRTGRRAGKRIDGRWYIQADEVERWLARRQPSRPRRPGLLSGPAEHALRMLQEWGSSTAEELSVVTDVHVGNARKALALAGALGLAKREGTSWSLTAEGERWVTEGARRTA
jgi:hypothetical protein